MTGRQGKVRNLTVEWECRTPGVWWDALNFEGSYLFNTDGGWHLCGNGRELSVGEKFTDAAHRAGRVLLGHEETP